MAVERERATQKTKGKGKARARARGGLKRLIERNTEAAERIHRAVAAFPLDVLERIGRFEKPVARVRKLQEQSIGARYAMVRGVEREIVRFVQAPDAAKRRAAKSAGPARKAKTAPAHAKPASVRKVSPLAASA